MDIEGKARQAELWSEAKDGAGKERTRRGWNKQRRCGDLLREKQMLCLTHIYCTEREREREQEDELESANPLTPLTPPAHPPPSLPAYTAIKAEQREPDDWHMTMQARGFASRETTLRTRTWKWTLVHRLDDMQRWLRLPTLLRSLRSHPPLHFSFLSCSRPSFFLFEFHRIAEHVFVCLLGPGSLAQRKKKIGRCI